MQKQHLHGFWLTAFPILSELITLSTLQDRAFKVNIWGLIRTRFEEEG